MPLTDTRLSARCSRDTKAMFLRACTLQRVARQGVSPTKGVAEQVLRQSLRTIVQRLEKLCLRRGTVVPQATSRNPRDFRGVRVGLPQRYE